MKDTIRTFVAIKICSGQKLLEVISILKKKFEEEEIRWVDVNNLHLTLRFLGETTPLQIESVRQFMDDFSRKYAQFQFEIKGLGCFVKNRNPSVLFARIENNSQLQNLAKEIEEQTVKFGFKNSKQGYHPHLTLGSIKSIKNKNLFYEIAEEFENVDLQKINVKEILFYESILGSGTPVYRPIKVVKLIK